MPRPLLKAGDLFAVNSPSLFGKAIRAVQRVWSWDSEAEYNHSGIILGPTGLTLEALTTYRIADLDQYVGQMLLIVRHKEMTSLRCATGLEAVKGDVGGFYPIHRLALFLVPPLAKFCLFGRGVCSEQTAKFMKGAGFLNVIYGVTPDNLADLWRESKSMDIIFEGVWNG